MTECSTPKMRKSRKKEKFVKRSEIVGKKIEKIRNSETITSARIDKKGGYLCFSYAGLTMSLHWLTCGL